MRRLASVPLTLFAIFLTAMGSLLMWADRQVFDENQVAGTTEAIVADPEMQEFLTRKLTDRVVFLVANESVRPVAEPLIAAQLADPSFQVSFTTATRETHRSLVSGGDTTVNFNLRELAGTVRGQIVAAVPDSAPFLPDPDTALNFSLIDRTRLPAVWTFADRAHDIALLFVVLGVALSALALLIGPTRWTLLLLYGVGSATLALVTIAVVRAGIRDATGTVGDPLANNAIKVVSRPFLDSLTTQCMTLAIAGSVVALIGATLGVLGVGRSSREPKRWSPPPSYRQNTWS